VDLCRTDDAQRIQRARLAQDVRRLIGFADAAVASAERLSAEGARGVADCTVVWRHWTDRLAEWGRVRALCH
jgi:hypothetical protein